MTVGSNIRSLRLKKHMSQEALGEVLGVSAQAVSKWEQGITSPDISLLPLISECFGVTIDSLFEGVQKRKYPGYRSERGELLALYEEEGGTDHDFAKVEEAYREVILSGKADVEDYLDYGRLFRMRAVRDNEKALYYYRRAISEGKEKRDLVWQSAHQAVTNLLKELGRLEEAIEEHRKWCEEEPEEASAHISYAIALEYAGRTEEAYEETKKALSLDENHGNAQQMMADMCVKLGRYEEAAERYEKAYELEPTSISCFFSKAEMYAGIGENEKAIAQYERILKWLEEQGYNMQLEGKYPRKRIEELKNKC